MQACLQPLFAIPHTATTEVGAAYGLKKLGTGKLSLGAAGGWTRAANRPTLLAMFGT